jgi:hypothetical protein
MQHPLLLLLPRLLVRLGLCQASQQQQQQRWLSLPP